MVSFSNIVVVAALLWLVYRLRASILKILFQIAYRLYNTRIGYRFIHCRQISRPGKLRVAHSHCKSIDFKMDNNDISVVSIPMMEDNYSYLIIDRSTSKCAVV